MFYQLVNQPFALSSTHTQFPRPCWYCTLWRSEAVKDISYPLPFPWNNVSSASPLFLKEVQTIGDQSKSLADRCVCVWGGGGGRHFNLSSFWLSAAGISMTNRRRRRRRRKNGEGRTGKGTGRRCPPVSLTYTFFMQLNPNYRPPLCLCLTSDVKP